jgi:type II secretory pathway pseudopilin PulG
MKNNKKNSAGQSLIELIFAVGVVVIVMVGIVILMVNTVGSKNKGLDKKEATELANVVMEDLVNKKRNDPENFWRLTNLSNEINANYDGYTYSVGFTNITGGNCSGPNGNYCTNAVVTINIGGSQIGIFQRFFSKNGN